MPHLILECSADLLPLVESSDLLAKSHQVMLSSGLFTPAAVKTRLHPVANWQVGEEGDARGFLHCLVYLMEGRDTLQKQALSNALFALLDPLVPATASLTVDIRELDKAIYRKRG